MAATIVVEARQLGRRYGEVVALAGLDLAIEAGEVFGLLGPNGAGKTTTIRILNTLERPDAGVATVFGLDTVRDAAAVRARIGYVPQELTADKYLTARESLELFCRLYHVPGSERSKRIDDLLELLSLGPAADRLVRTYSGGMKKKLDLACGLVHQPDLLLLDEPSLGLDVATRRLLWDYILELRSRGMTIILCSNDMNEADRLCDRLAIIDRGTVVSLGSPDELRAGLGGDVVSLEIGDGDKRRQVADRWQSLGLVGETFEEGPRLHGTVHSNESALPALIGAARDVGAEVIGASYHRPSLEEVFLRHAGRRFADAHGVAGPPPRRRRA